MYVFTSAKTLVLASLIASGISLEINSIKDITVILSEDAYANGTKRHQLNNSFNANELCVFIKNFKFFNSSLTTLDTSVIYVLADSKNPGSFINFAEISRIYSDILTLSEADFDQFCKNATTDLPETVPDKPSKSETWGFGILAVTIISLCSLVGISLLPLMKSEWYDKVLLYLIALAVGTLSSNAIFHLIPEGFGIDSDPMAVWQSAVIFGGFYIFYLIESILERVFNISQNHESVETITGTETDAYSTGLSMQKNHQNNESKTQAEESDEIVMELPTVSGAMKGSKTDQTSEPSLRPASVLAANEKRRGIFRNFRSIKTVAWMITVADGIHNFIDGLVIGASFSVSLVQGLSTSLAIFCEEFPHELGDFAILISSGMTIRQAAFYNFASACCCYLGLIAGIFIGDNFAAAQWIFALAGGVFLYISLAGMLPEAQAHCTKRSLKHSPWLCFFLKNAGLLSGFAIMLLLTVFEDDISVV